MRTVLASSRKQGNFAYQDPHLRAMVDLGGDSISRLLGLAGNLSVLSSTPPRSALRSSGQIIIERGEGGPGVHGTVLEELRTPAIPVG